MMLVAFTRVLLLYGHSWEEQLEGTLLGNDTNADCKQSHVTGIIPLKRYVLTTLIIVILLSRRKTASGTI